MTGHTLATPLCLQSINLRQGSLSAGYSLLLKSGPHWLELSPAALPLHIYGSGRASGSGGSGDALLGAGSNEVPPVQVGVRLRRVGCSLQA